MMRRSTPPLAVSLSLILGVTTPATAGTLLVANKAAATLSLIADDSGRVVATLPTGPGPHEIAVSPDGRLALVANYGGPRPGSTLTLVDVPSARVLDTIDLGRYRRPHGVTFLDDRRALVTVEQNRAVVEVDVEDRRVVRAMATDQEVSHMVVATPDGDRAFVANIGSGTVTALDLEAGRKIGDLPTGDGAEGIALSPEGDRLWVSNRAAGTVTVVDAVSLEQITELPCAGFPIRVELTPDGRHALVSAARAGSLCVFDARALRPLRNVEFDASAAGGDRLLDFGDSPVPIGIQIDPAGGRAWVALSNADRVAELDLTSWTVVRLLETGREPDGMGYSPLDVGGTR